MTGEAARIPMQRWDQNRNQDPDALAGTPYLIIVVVGGREGGATGTDCL